MYERPDTPASSVFGLARAQLAAVVSALGLDHDDPDGAGLLRDLFDELVAGPTGDPSLDMAPRWSGLSDDCTPVEFSVAFRPNGADLRVLVEAQADPPTPGTYWRSSGRLTEWFGRRIGSSSSRLAEVEDLFTPVDRPSAGPPPLFVAMHAAEVRVDGPPRVKLYLNPAARGIPAVQETLELAMERMGLGPAWSRLAPELAGVPVELIALDLEDGPDARVKLYARPRSGVEEVERIAGLADGAVPGAPVGLLRSLTGGTRVRRPVFVVLHLLAGSPAPVRSVVDVPIPGHVGSDEAAVEAIGRLLESEGLDAEAYRRVAGGFADACPSPVSGLHSYVSLQSERNRSRVTTYFNSRAFAPRFGWLAVDPMTTWPSAGMT